MAEKENAKKNPFARPTPKPAVHKPNVKNLQRNKMNNFRNALNKGLFDQDDGNNAAEPFEEKKQQVKLPPKQSKEGELLAYEAAELFEADKNGEDENWERNNEHEVHGNRANPLSYAKNGEHGQDDFFSNKERGQSDKKESGKENSVNLNESEERCVSITHSEPKEKHSNPLKSHSSNDKNLFNSENNSHSHSEQGKMLKIEKSAVFKKSEGNKREYRPTSIDSKSLKTSSNKQEESVKEEPSKENLRDPNCFSSNELSKRLEKFKTEIRELKQNKNSAETKYEVEANKCERYEKEISDLRAELSQCKAKSFSESESMLKLDNENLNDKLRHKTEEIKLLQRENDSLASQVKKMQEYIEDLIKNRKTLEGLTKEAAGLKEEISGKKLESRCENKCEEQIQATTKKSTNPAEKEIIEHNEKRCEEGEKKKPKEVKKAPSLAKPPVSKKEKVPPKQKEENVFEGLSTTQQNEKKSSLFHEFEPNIEEDVFSMKTAKDTQSVSEKRKPQTSLDKVDSPMQVNKSFQRPTGPARVNKAQAFNFFSESYNNEEDIGNIFGTKGEESNAGNSLFD